MPRCSKYDSEVHGSVLMRLTSVDATNKAENQISARHSCQACKAWRRVHEQHSEQITQSDMEVEHTTLVVHADASLQGADLSWEGYCRVIRTPQYTSHHVSRDIENQFLDQHRHNVWARSSEEIQWVMMTKRRRRRLNRCRECDGCSPQ